MFDSLPTAIQLEVVELESEKIRVEADGVVPCEFRVRIGPDTPHQPAWA